MFFISTSLLGLFGRPKSNTEDDEEIKIEVGETEDKNDVLQQRIFHSERMAITSDIEVGNCWFWIISQPSCFSLKFQIFKTMKMV